MLTYLKKNGIIIITEPLVKPCNWKNNGLNENSNEFSKSMWERKKKELEDEHEFIMNFPNTSYTEYDFSRVYIIQKN